jgi:hypothetical protein
VCDSGGPVKQNQRVTVESQTSRAWYAKTFGAIQDGDVETLLGVKLEFSKSATIPMGTKGRVLDHIGLR